MRKAIVYATYGAHWLAWYYWPDSRLAWRLGLLYLRAFQRLWPMKAR